MAQLLDLLGYEFVQNAILAGFVIAIVAGVYFLLVLFHGFVLVELFLRRVGIPILFAVAAGLACVGAGFLARSSVAMQGALLDGLVDPRDQRLVLRGDGAGVPRLNDRLEPLEMGLHRAPKAQVLEPLTL